MSSRHQWRAGHKREMHSHSLPFASRPVRKCGTLTLCLADPANIEGNAETAQVLGLTPWTDYEFRVLASNILGTGEPSGPSSKIQTKEAGQSPGGAVVSGTDASSP